MKVKKNMNVDLLKLDVDLLKLDINLLISKYF